MRMNRGFEVRGMSSPGRFAPPAQPLERDYSPYRVLHVRCDSLGRFVSFKGHSFSVRPTQTARFATGKLHYEKPLKRIRLNKKGWAGLGRAERDARGLTMRERVPQVPNEIVCCEKCGMWVHQSCYAIKDIPEGEWLCWPCREHLDPDAIKCALCPVRKGAFKKTTCGQWCHMVCAHWMPEISVLVRV
jgi:hypothetical protein